MGNPSTSASEFFREALRGRTKEDLTRETLFEMDRLASRRRAVSAILEQSLGIDPASSDAAYTLHPLMAGTLRQLVGAAFDQGSAAISMALLKDWALRNPSPDFGNAGRAASNEGELRKDAPATQSADDPDVDVGDEKAAATEQAAES